MIKKKLRSCAYCGLPGYRPTGDRGPRCKCKYRAGRMGEVSYTMSNISRETTVAELFESVNDFMKHFDPEKRVAFSFSVTTLDAKSIAKADAKRALGKENL